jgi:3-phenylpropionate/trans-cinnamate dioxygenase ferredoxin subunit
MASEKQYTWHKIAESMAELVNVKGNPCQLRVGGRDICVAVVQDKAYGCAARCPHAGGRLAEGWVDPLGNVVCPLHRYRFSLANGRNTSGEGYFLKTYPVMENDEGLFVGLDKSGW